MAIGKYCNRNHNSKKHEMVNNVFHSNGKFLLTSEYLVLRGALSLALPLKLGQSLEVKPLDESLLKWNAFTPNGAWFSAVLDVETLQVKSADDKVKAEKLSSILLAVKQLNPDVFSKGGMEFNTRLGFNTEWGLGSSSTLIANLARWANVNPYELLRLTFGGSGYDIACATAEPPILYQLVEGKPQVQSVKFSPAFSDRLFFVYQGQKQSSSKEVGSFKERMRQMNIDKEIDAVSEITKSLVSNVSFDDFCRFMQEHESIISHCIGREPLQQHFSDFKGTIKSLGAWGGDFFMAATDWDAEKVKRYFAGKGLMVVFGYKEMVL